MSTHVTCLCVPLRASTAHHVTAYINQIVLKKLHKDVGSEL